MREGTTLKVMAADRPYGKFYDFYSVSPENFGSTLVLYTFMAVQSASHVMYVSNFIRSELLA